LTNSIKKMKKILLLLISMCSLFFANAQNSPAAILQKTLDKIHSLKSLSYDYSSVQKNPYSTGDTSYWGTHSVLVFDNNGQLKATHDQTIANKGGTEFESIFKNDTLFQIDIKDSSYSFYPKPEKSTISNGIISVNKTIAYNLSKNPSKIFRRKDTVVNNATCYNFFIKAYDSVENGQHDYTYDFIIIDKNTQIPVFFKEIGEGTAEKDGHVIGRLSFYNEDRFSNILLNKEVDESLFYFDRSKFSLPVKKMLAEGAIAPKFKLKDMENREVSAADLSNKLLLIEFGATDCGANPLANPMLNRLNKKYASTSFSIVSIYSSEPAEKVKKYIESNKLEFPVYLGDLKTKKAFKTVGTPNFYLIDKTGQVIKSIDGYNDDLEKDLTEKIDEVLKK
jgi:thiol-disulfide isomerase/thioredoxin